MDGANQDIFRLFFVFAHQNQFIDTLIVFLATYFPYLLIVGFLAFSFSRKDRREGLFIFIEGMLAAIISRSIITESIRFFYDHPRPFAALDLSPLVHSSSNSFPSGHAAIFFAMATTLYFFDKRLGGWFFLLALINGISRVTAGVHWPLDILGGAVIGIASGFFVHKLSERSWRELEFGAKTNTPKQTESTT
ncbi:MAG: phosphatase PAP2 family protein [Patescibacteria group bacterium]